MKNKLEGGDVEVESKRCRWKRLGNRQSTLSERAGKERLRKIGRRRGKIGGRKKIEEED